MAKKFELTTIRLNDGGYVTSDKMFFVYAWGRTASESFARYETNFIENCRLLRDTIGLDKRKLAKMEKCLKKLEF